MCYLCNCSDVATPLGHVIQGFVQFLAYLLYVLGNLYFALISMMQRLYLIVRCAAPLDAQQNL